MRPLPLLFAVASAAAAPHAAAYCIHNQIPDRAIAIEQEPHPDKLRDERRLHARIPPGRSRCCSVKNLDCNPDGRLASVVNIAITIPGEPPYACGFPPGAEPMVKVTGGGTVRVMRNPNAKSATPYIVRIRTQDGQSLTPPHGLACPPDRFPTKGK
jgi:hypothetical protein